MEKISGISWSNKQYLMPSGSMLSNQLETKILYPNLVRIPLNTYKAYALSFGSELYTDKDILRFKKIQLDWAKKNGIDPDRLPDIKLAELDDESLGSFKIKDNIILINPNKKAFNASGGAKRTVIHESVHGYYHNLRRAWAYQNLNTVKETLKTVIFSRILHGDNTIILAGNTNHQNDLLRIKNCNLMSPPLISENERHHLFETIKQMTSVDLKVDEKGLSSLSEQGNNTIKGALRPHLTDYCKYLELQGVPSNKIEETALRDIINYTNALYYRKDLLCFDLLTKKYTDLPNNLNKLLTKEEQEIAIQSISDHLDTREGNLFLELSKQMNEKTLKLYFLSGEERLARKAGIDYDLERINSRIKIAEQKSFKVPKSYIDHKIIMENDQKIMELVAQLNKTELDIATAPKNYLNLAELAKIKNTTKEFIPLFNELNNKGLNIFEFFKNKSIDIAKTLSKDDIKNLDKNSIEKIIIEKIIISIKEVLPENFYNLVDKFGSQLNDKEKRLEEKQLKEKLSKPENLLLDTTENRSLLTRYNKLLAEIKQLITVESEISALPEFLFESKEQYLAHCERGKKLRSGLEKTLKSAIK